MYSTLIRNSTPTVNQPGTPYFDLYGVYPDITMFEVFVCPAWVRILAARRTSSLAPHAGKGIFLGLTLPLSSKSSYKLVNGKVIVSTDVMRLQAAENLFGPVHSDNLHDIPVSNDMSSSLAPAPNIQSLPFGLTLPPHSFAPQKLDALSIPPAPNPDQPNSNSPPPLSPLDLHASDSPASSISMLALEWSSGSEHSSSSKILELSSIDNMEVVFPIKSANTADL